ncbi:hypothetical protein [Lentzea flava]|uniref:Proteins of 100 residues with WXG n=1 Tax=Lentzea flava TaxID=103732 RepID=A0ABQ2UDT2_9PSEU|nr:hypothetical protein [Lentzea flava]MCP2198025.1 hypothetical protein [Lentzea flava]GGU24131.1 hypothetical protein GCM10010178_15430 [Lentzea flava]
MSFEGHFDANVEDDGEWRRAVEQLGPAMMQLLSVYADFEGEEDQLPNYIPRMEEMFRLFASGSQHPADEIAKAMRAGRDLMIAVKEKHLADVKTYVGEWHGAAAEQFEVYLNSMTLAIRRYEDALDAIAVLVEAYRGLVVAMRKDVVAMVQRVFSGLEAAEQAQLKISLAIATAFVAAIGSVVTGGAATGLAVEALSGTIGVSMEQIGASDEFHVLASMVDQGEQIIEEVRHARKKIEAGFRAVTESMIGSHMEETRPPRPEIVTAPSFDPKDFGLPEEYQRGHQLPAPGGPLVEQPPKDTGPDSDIDDETGLDVYPEQVMR